MSGIVARDVTHPITPRSGTLDQLLPIFILFLTRCHFRGGTNCAWKVIGRVILGCRCQSWGQAAEAVSSSCCSSCWGKGWAGCVAGSQAVIPSWLAAIVAAGWVTVGGQKAVVRWCQAKGGVWTWPEPTAAATKVTFGWESPWRCCERQGSAWKVHRLSLFHFSRLAFGRAATITIWWLFIVDYRTAKETAWPEKVLH